MSPPASRFLPAVEGLGCQYPIRSTPFSRAGCLRGRASCPGPCSPACLGYVTAPLRAAALRARGLRLVRGFGQLRGAGPIGFMLMKWAARHKRALPGFPLSSRFVGGH